MAEFYTSIAVAADDGQIDGSNNFDSSASFHYIGNYSSSVYRSFYRFINITVPKGSTITMAVVSFAGAGLLSANSVKQNVYVNDSSNAVAPTTYEEFDSLSLLTAVPWTLDTWQNNSYRSTPSLVTSIQAIVNKTDWVSGNSIMVLLKDDTSTTNAYRTCRSSTYKPQIYIRYTEPPIRNDSYTKILMHFNGEQDSTEINDEAGNIWTREAFVAPITDGSLILDYSYPCWNLSPLGMNLKIASANEYLHLIAPAALNMGSSNFTFDFWQRLQMNPSEEDADTVFYLDWNNGPNNYFQLVKVFDTYDTFHFEFTAVAGGVDLGTLNLGAANFGNQEFAHFELCRDGLNYRMFARGTLLATVAVAEHTYDMTGADCKIYYNGPGASWLEEFRYSNGIARHSTTFVPLTYEYLGLINSDVTVEETLDLADTQTVYLNGTTYSEEISEELILLDDYNLPCWMEIIDNILIYDISLTGWRITADEVLSIVDTLSNIWGIPIDDWLTLIDTESNNWNGREIVPDRLTLYDISGLGRIYDNTIDESIVMVDTISYRLTLTILEYLGFAELANAVRTSHDSVNDSLILEDLLDRGYSLAVEDILMAVDATSLIALFFDALQESLIMTDVSGVFKRIADTLTESISFTENITTHGHLYSVVYDSLMMNVLVELNNEVYECYVLNTPKMFPSVYSGYNFNSYCVFENRAFGANNMGIYELTGSTDAGAEIHTGVILSSTDFNAPNQKRFRKGYLGITGDQTVMVFEGEDGTRKAYNVNTDGKMMASHSLKSKTWELSVADFESLNYMKLIPIILTK